MAYHRHVAYSNHLGPSPEAPEVSTGATISYGQAYRGEPPQQPLARSFSQRAKEQQKLAREAFHGKYGIDDENIPSPNRTLEDNPAPTLEPLSAPPKRSESNGIPLELDYDQAQSQPDPQGPSVDSRQSTPKASRHHSQSVQYAADMSPPAADPNSSLGRSSTTRGAKPSKSRKRDWAPQRSPLQTLEVQLNDISKEEKRARVEEAEMLLRESKAGRGGRKAGKETPAASKQRQAMDDVPPERKREHQPNLDRAPTQSQRLALHGNNQVEPPKPGQRPWPSHEEAFILENRGQPPLGSPRADQMEFSYQPASQQKNRKADIFTRPVGDAQDCGFQATSDASEGQSRSVADIRSRAGNSESTGDAAAWRPGGSMRRPEPRNRSYTDEMRRTTSIRRVPVAQSIPSNITRAVSLQQSQRQPVFAEDQDKRRVGLMRDSNSSHRAALVEPNAASVSTRAPIVPAAQHEHNKKLQKARPEKTGKMAHPGPGEPKTIDGGVSRRSTSERKLSPPEDPDDHESPSRFYYRGMPAQSDMENSNSQPVRVPGNLDFENPSVSAEKDEMDRRRQANVSFNVPSGTIHHHNEWQRAEVARLTPEDLALDLDPERDAAWWETNQGTGRRKSGRRPSGIAGASDAYSQLGTTRAIEFQPPLYLMCGPLLRYTGIRTERAEPQPGQLRGTIDRETWRGSVLIVTLDSQSSYHDAPIMRLFAQPIDLRPPPPEEVQGDELAPEDVDPIAGLTKVSRRGQPLYVKPVDHLEEGKDLSRIEDEEGLFETSPMSPPDHGNSHGSSRLNGQTHGQDGEALGKYREVEAARLYADAARDVTFWRFNVEVELGDRQTHIAYRINRGPPVGFWVPAKGQSMNIMFHSCNGFSLAANPAQFGGPDPLWRDVLNTHQTRPFHVMIGGGDQIYNDRVVVETQHFRSWTRLRNPTEKRNAYFSNEMREELESYYLNRYAMWFSQGLFGLANSQIPMVNIYDDHDIIDGFGSYPDDFQRSPVFMGIGGIAFKYYMLFQHQSVPEETQAHEPSWVLGAKPGPYIQHLSRSVFLNLGRGVALLGIDCRTERERHSVLTDDTYDIILERCRREIEEGETRHLLVLLGVPVAYPRLVWLESILTSRAMIPVKALSRTAIIKGGLLNKFDGGVEVLDDLDDHWTASGHKAERNMLIHDLQELAAEKSVRITVLGGDVHLGAIGQFYSNPELGIAKDRDHRYMVNVISSAIVNTPPPEMVADTLNKRNKVHYLDGYTAEDMIPIFTHDVDGKKRNNRRLLPRRNWCSIREYHPGSTPPPTPPESPTPSDQMSDPEDVRPSSGLASRRRFSFSRDDANPRNLLRRLSQRGAPPSSYRDEMNISSPTAVRRASHDGYFGPQSAPAIKTTFPTNGTGPQMTPHTAPPNRSSFNQARSSYHQNTSLDDLPSKSAPRPGILRRPTNLTEKAAKKGGPPPSYDSQGNLMSEDLHDHIDLEGGLDISLNCELNQGDPAGITTPYRLLVPALHYDGTSDRQKLEGPSGLRKPTLLNKFGFGQKTHRNMANRQGEGNWGQKASDSGSESFSEEERTESDDGHDADQERWPWRGEGLKRWLSNRRRGSKSSYPTTYQEDQLRASNYHDGAGQIQRSAVNDDADRGLQPTSSLQQDRWMPSQPYNAAAAPAIHANDNGWPPAVNDSQGSSRPVETGPFRPQPSDKAARIMGFDQGPPQDRAIFPSSRSPQTTTTSVTSDSSSSSSSSSLPRLPERSWARNSAAATGSQNRHHNHQQYEQALQSQGQHHSVSNRIPHAQSTTTAARNSLASPPPSSRVDATRNSNPISSSAADPASRTAAYVPYSSTRATDDSNPADHPFVQKTLPQHNGLNQNRTRASPDHQSGYSHNGVDVRRSNTTGTRKAIPHHHHEPSHRYTETGPHDLGPVTSTSSTSSSPPSWWRGDTRTHVTAIPAANPPNATNPATTISSSSYAKGQRYYEQNRDRDRDHDHDYDYNDDGVGAGVGAGALGDDMAFRGSRATWLGTGTGTATPTATGPNVGTATLKRKGPRQGQGQRRATIGAGPEKGQGRTGTDISKNRLLRMWF